METQQPPYDQARERAGAAKRGRLPVALAAAGAAAALAVGALAIAEKVTEPTEPIVVDGFESAAESGGGFFYSRCEFDLRSGDDPIVHPGMPGMAHATTADPAIFVDGTHDFAGARGVHANTTPEDLARSATTCRDRQLKTAYWVPTLAVDGEPIAPLFFNVRYGRGPAGQKSNAVKIQPLPPGLRLVAGSTAKSVQWNCSPTRPKVEDKTSIPDCGPDREATVNILFPQCWNGQLDSADHRSHLAYPSSAKCPASHPIILPHLQLKVHYGKGRIPAGDAVLASGAGLTMHADLFTPSDMDRHIALVSYCIIGGRNCGEAATPPP